MSGKVVLVVLQEVFHLPKTRKILFGMTNPRIGKLNKEQAKMSPKDVEIMKRSSDLTKLPVK